MGDADKNIYEKKIISREIKKIFVTVVKSTEAYYSETLE